MSFALDPEAARQAALTFTLAVIFIWIMFDLYLSGDDDDDGDGGLGAA